MLVVEKYFEDIIIVLLILLLSKEIYVKDDEIDSKFQKKSRLKAGSRPKKDYSFLLSSLLGQHFG